ncbi:MAG: FAD-binding protein, partial [Ignavibacteriaceae bacterium]|nr:FAD-binding protein [Ignavibacteriaceae bacterium]
HSDYQDPNLPAASYSLACNLEGKGVYSFCMCPGGIIVPAATAPGEIIVNGMSLSRRDSPFANSGLVIAVDERDWAVYDKEYPFSALQLQIDVEHKAFELANRTQKAPAQRLTDFMNNKLSTDLPPTSYIPGLTSAPLHEALPDFVVKGLKRGMNIFNRYLKGYYSEEAQLVAVESRTSSPVRVLRNRETYMDVTVEGLFPAGEGAGYAGGIVSAAIDGENCAGAVARYLNN